MATDYLDILLDADFDLAYQGGDFKIDKSLEQEFACILRLAPAELGINPLLGPALYTSINSEESLQKKAQRIKLHLEADGVTDVKIAFKDSKVKLEGERP